jgi:fimbrial isopeptide formation D2 family protein/LPXTG-motif cell wall-anchored protein
MTEGLTFKQIVSELGENLVLATTDVNIKEKNDYPGVTKTVAAEDATAQIGDTINYTLTVSVPEGANQEIVLTDTMTEGLTFKQIVSVKVGDADVDYTASAVDTDTNSFTITFSAATVTANQNNTITILYEATLNEKAVVETTDVNTVKLNYGNKYESKPEHADTDTNKFAVLKYNGADTEKNPLAGATFQLRIGTTVVKLIKVNDTTYRVANGDETGAVETFTTVATDKVTIYGVDKDVAYNILETEAPDGFNKMKDPFDITVEDDNSLIAEVPNNTGTELPSTGGIGTTIFYVLGGLLIVGAAVILVARKKASN